MQSPTIRTTPGGWSLVSRSPGAARMTVFPAGVAAVTRRASRSPTSSSRSARWWSAKSTSSTVRSTRSSVSDGGGRVSAHAGGTEHVVVDRSSVAATAVGEDAPTRDYRAVVLTRNALPVSVAPRALQVAADLIGVALRVIRARLSAVGGRLPRVLPGVARWVRRHDAPAGEDGEDGGSHGKEVRAHGRRDAQAMPARLRAR